MDKHADNKRRLPVLSSASEPDEPARPPWHWVGFGAVAIFATWLPLSALAQIVLRRMLLARFGSEVDEAEMGARLRAMTAGEQARQVMMLAVPHLVALAIGAFAGGLLVGRYGGVTRREPAMAGFFAGFVACVLAFASSGGISWPPLVVVVLATGFAGAGGVVGLKRRA